MRPRRGIPRFRDSVSVEQEQVVRRYRLGRVERVRREEVVEVGWWVDEGFITDTGYLALMDGNGRGVAVPEEMAMASGVVDWCAELPGWDWDEFAKAQADVGPHWRTIWERPNRR